MRLGRGRAAGRRVPEFLIAQLGKHLAFDATNNFPLANLFVSRLHHLGFETDTFASSTGPLAGLGPDAPRFPLETFATGIPIFNVSFRLHLHQTLHENLPLLFLGRAAPAPAAGRIRSIDPGERPFDP